MFHRLIEPTAQDPSSSSMVTYQKETTHTKWIERGVGVFAFLVVLVTALNLGNESPGLGLRANAQGDHYHANREQLALLDPHFSMEVPQAIGGSDAPYIEDGVLYSFSGYRLEEYSQEPITESNGLRYYVVQDGDTLSEIAEKYEISVKTIVWENDIRNNTITPGQELVILPVTGVRHEIESGDTISTIAQKYDVDSTDIEVYNDIDETKLVVGEFVMVPNGVKASPRPQQTQSTSSQPSYVPTTQVNTTSIAPSPSRGYYIRPTGGVVTSHFGPRSRGYHYGIDYGAPTGTPIVASASGTVIKTSCGSGYGRCLVLQHDNGTQTLYAHASRLFVSTGARVEQGEKIAAVGSTGRSSGPHLHFEIIKANGQKVNPASYVQ